MSSILKNINKVLILLTVSVLLLSTVANAEPTLQHPNLYFNGNYTYTLSTHELSLYNFNIVAAESAEFTPYPMTDPITPFPFSTITFGPLYNSDANPYVFGASSGTSDPVSFLIEDSVGNDHLTATLGNFVVENSSGAILKWGSLQNIAKGSTGSRYLTDIGDNDLNLWMSFTGNDGVEGFDTAYTDGESKGTIQGNIRVAVVPEPVSTSLFITGVLTLVLRRRFKKA